MKSVLIILGISLSLVHFASGADTKWLLLWSDGVTAREFTVLPLAPLEKELYANNRTVCNWLYTLSAEWSPNIMIGALGSIRPHAGSVDRKLRELREINTAEFNQSYAINTIFSAITEASGEMLSLSLVCPLSLEIGKLQAGEPALRALTFVTSPIIMQCRPNAPDIRLRGLLSICDEINRAVDEEAENLNSSNATLQYARDELRKSLNGLLGFAGSCDVEIAPESLNTVIAFSSHKGVKISFDEALKGIFVNFASGFGDGRKFKEAQDIRR